MTHDVRKEEMKRYQKGRTKLRRARGLTSRTLWIRAEDIEDFQQATAIFIDHARLIEGVTGGIRLSAKDVTEIVTRHHFPYAPEDLVFLSRINDELSLKTMEWKHIEEKAKATLQKYCIAVSFEELIDS